jgi:hypothetical protein
MVDNGYSYTVSKKRDVWVISENDYNRMVGKDEDKVDDARRWPVTSFLRSQEVGI